MKLRRSVVWTGTTWKKEKEETRAGGAGFLAYCPDGAIKHLHQSEADRGLCLTHGEQRWV